MTKHSRTTLCTIALGTIALIALVPGCTSTRLTNMWSDPVFAGPPFGKVLVIAMRNNAARRRIWEDAFALDLGTHGVAVTPSYRIFPDNPPDTTQIADAVLKNGFDGILVSHRLPGETETDYIPGYVTKTAQTVYDSTAQRFFTHYERVEHPGYVDSERVARTSTDVW
ncbi:MAG TPA: hypothetical protein VKS81_06770, partial [Bacteroidota bacterium]|nr:hypothetical protein [Bacteroidota bacterium]